MLRPAAIETIVATKRRCESFLFFITAYFL